LMEIAYLLTDEVLEECEAPFTQEKLIKAIS
jgi:hypothetical protein